VKQVERRRVKCAKTIGREIGILTTLDHPNICKMFESYVNSHFIYLVMEFIEGHDLQHEIDENIRLKQRDEARYSAIISQLFDATKYCHDLGVVHRDLQPANIMVCDTTIDYVCPSIKLIGFGLALEGSPNEGHNTGRLEGGMAYLAPEVHLATIYSEASDMYSIGVIIFVMLLECFPSNNVHNDVLEIESLDGRDLVSGLLKRDPRLRLMAAQAAKHPWTQQHKCFQTKGSWGALQRKGSQDASMSRALGCSAESDQVERWLLSLDTSVSLNDVAGLSTEEFDGMLTPPSQ
jgi:serine/threonine protein kinase